MQGYKEVRNQSSELNFCDLEFFSLYKDASVLFSCVCLDLLAQAKGTGIQAKNT